MANINIYNLESSDSLVDLDEEEDVTGGFVIGSFNAQMGMAVNVGEVDNPQWSGGFFGGNFSYNVLTQRASVNNTIF